MVTGRWDMLSGKKRLWCKKESRLDLVDIKNPVS